MPARSSNFGRGQQIFVVAVAAHGDDVRMLDDQQLIGNLAALAALDQILLQGERVGVAHAAEMLHVQARRRSQRETSARTAGAGRMLLQHFRH